MSRYNNCCLLNADAVHNWPPNDKKSQMVYFSNVLIVMCKPPDFKISQIGVFVQIEGVCVKSHFRNHFRPLERGLLAIATFRNAIYETPSRPVVPVDIGQAEKDLVR